MSFGEAMGNNRTATRDLRGWLKPPAGLALAGLLLFVLGLAGCGSSGGPLVEVDRPSLAAYQLGAGDRVKIFVLENDDLEVESLIDEDGHIEVPLIGEVRAAGRTVSSLKAVITERLANGYIIDPKVVVEILGYSPFYVLGQVTMPGSFEFRPNLTIRKAVAVAGGFTRRADTDFAYLVRRVDGEEVRSRVSLDTILYPGDLIEIDRRLF